MDFALQPRQGLIVYTYNMKQMKQLKRYGTVHYISKKMRYAILYINKDQVAETKHSLEQLKFIKRVRISPRPELKTTFGEDDQTTEE